MDPLGQLDRAVIRVSKGLLATRVHQVLMEIWDLRVNLVQVDHQEIQVNLDSKVPLVHKEVLGLGVSPDPRDFLGIPDRVDRVEARDFLGIQEELEL